MCFIAIAKRVKNTEADTNIEKVFRNILYDQMTSNRDGFFVQSNLGTVRSMEYDDALKAIKSGNIENMWTHFRIATTGKVELTNVHGWKIGDWMFSHNGSVSQYTGTRLDPKTDSLQFFEVLKAMLKNKTRPDKVMGMIQKMASAKSFFGRACLYNTLHDDMYLFGDFHVNYVNGKYIFFSSAEIELDKMVKYYNVHGLSFNGEVDTEFDVLHEKIDGVYLIRNFSKPTWNIELLSSKFKEETYRNYGRQNALHDVHRKIDGFKDKEEEAVAEQNFSTGTNTKAIIGAPTALAPSSTALVRQTESEDEGHSLEVFINEKQLYLPPHNHPLHCICGPCMDWNEFVWAEHLGRSPELCMCTRCVITRSNRAITLKESEGCGKCLMCRAGAEEKCAWKGLKIIGLDKFIKPERISYVKK